MEDKLKKANELENEARTLRQQASEEKRQAQLKKEKEFETENKMDVYTSDDYCGLEAGDYSFYYGYEVTLCPIKSHKENCEDNGCEKREWAFEAKKNGKRLLILPKSKLHPKENEEPFWYLIAGIGHLLKGERTVNG